MKKILVLCTGNSCRSQMAEGYLKLFTKDKADVYSAGIETHGVNEKAIAVMKQDGVDISKNTSNNIEEYRGMHFDFVITVCDHAREVCPFFPAGAINFHHDFPDPAKVKGDEETVMQEFIKVRDMIKKYCRGFVVDHI
ncbi:MAG: arsenate reductase ArsC [Ginsengibacter sp.]